MIGSFCWYLDQNTLAHPSLAQCIENQRKTVYREKKIKRRAERQMREAETDETAESRLS